MISGIIKVEVGVISRSRRLTETLIIPDITKTESNNWEYGSSIGSPMCENKIIIIIGRIPDTGYPSL